MPKSVYDGATWQDVRDPSVYDGAAHKDCEECYVYDGSQWHLYYIREISTQVTATAASGTVYAGDTLTVSGTVRDSRTGSPITGAEGTVTIESSYTGENNWTTWATGKVLDASGNYSHTGTVTSPGSLQFRATFVPAVDSYALPASGISPSKTISLKTPANFTKSTVSHTSARVTWSGVTGASGYQIYRNGSYLASTTAGNYTNSGLAYNSTYRYKVRAYTNTPLGTVYSSFTSEYTMSTGRPEVRDSGSTGWINVSPNSTGQYRNDVGWGYVGSDMRQAYYSSSYSGDGYRGLAAYASNKIRDAVRSACGGGSRGTTRQQNGTCSAYEVYLLRESGVGTGGGVTVSFYNSDKTSTSGGKPGTQGSKSNSDHGSPGTGKWHSPSNSLGQRLGDGTDHSIMIYRGNTSSGYASFNGGGTGKCRLKWSWNYVEQSYIAPKWS